MTGAPHTCPGTRVLPGARRRRGCAASPAGGHRGSAGTAAPMDGALVQVPGRVSERSELGPESCSSSPEDAPCADEAPRPRGRSAARLVCAPARAARLVCRVRFRRAPPGGMWPRGSLPREKLISQQLRCMISAVVSPEVGPWCPFKGVGERGVKGP